MDSWRLLLASYPDPGRNLAVEEAVARAVARGDAPSTVRFWTDKNAVIVGRFQDASMEVNVEACRKYGTAVARRFTGGGAVYHDSGNLNWTVAVHRDHPLVKSCGIDIPRIFDTLSAGVVRGLRDLGADAAFVPPSDIRVRGRKISGTAGALKWGAVFFHGTLLVSSDLRVIEEVLDAPPQMLPDPRFVRSVKKPMITLQEVLGRAVRVDQARDRLTEGFQAALGVRLARGDLTPGELAFLAAFQAHDRDRYAVNWGDPGPPRSFLLPEGLARVEAAVSRPTAG